MKMTTKAVKAVCRCDATSTIFSWRSLLRRSFATLRRRELGTGKEDAGDETFDRPMRHNPEQDDVDRYRDHDVNDEGAGRSKPDRQRPSSCRQHERGESSCLAARRGR